MRPASSSRGDVVVPGLQERHGRQGRAAGLAVEVREPVLDVGPQSRVGHDRARILHRVADPAVVRSRATVVIPLAEIAPGDAVGGELVADRRKRMLWRNRERRGVLCPVDVVAGVVVVEQVVVPWRAQVGHRIGERVEVGEDTRDSRLIVIGAVGVAAALGAGAAGASVAVAVLGVEVVGIPGHRLGVGVLDLATGGRGRVSGRVLVERRVAGPQHDVVGSGAAHYRLVVVVGHRVVARQIVEGRGVAGGHVVEAHVERTLVGRLVGERVRWRIAIGVTRGLMHPREQVTRAVGDLLIHLVEAVERITDVGPVELARPVLVVLTVTVEVGHVLGDLVGSVGQVGGEAAVRGVRALAVARLGNISGVGLR